MGTQWSRGGESGDPLRTALYYHRHAGTAGSGDGGRGRCAVADIDGEGSACVRGTGTGAGRVGTPTGSDSRGLSFAARHAAVGQDAGGFSYRRVCADG